MGKFENNVPDIEQCTAVIIIIIIIINYHYTIVEMRSGAPLLGLAKYIYIISCVPVSKDRG